MIENFHLKQKRDVSSKSLVYRIALSLSALGFFAVSPGSQVEVLLLGFHNAVTQFSVSVLRSDLQGSIYGTQKEGLFNVPVFRGKICVFLC